MVPAGPGSSICAGLLAPGSPARRSHPHPFLAFHQVPYTNPCCLRPVLCLGDARVHSLVHVAGTFWSQSAHGRLHPH